MRRSTFVMAMFGLAALLHVVFACAAFPTTVNYQGELRENGVPREGTVDLVFYVFDEAGTHVQTLGPRTCRSIVACLPPR